MSSESDRPDVLSLIQRPVTILVGHFGSGKTEIAINLALALREAGRAVSLVDLDVVKPYFRSRYAAAVLTERGVNLVVPRGEYFQADLPVVSPEVRGAVGRSASGAEHVIIDAGGAETGVRVLGSIPGLDDPAVADTLFVVNSRRPFAETAEAVLRMMSDIERATGLRVTGIVSNSHLLEETTLEVVREGIVMAAEVSVHSGAPIRFHAVMSALAPALANLTSADGCGPVPLLCIDRHIMPPPDRVRPVPGRRSSIS
ncbi:MAG: cobalamin biosynthesis protein CbiA [Vicinamibacterales bacterium]